ncbi:hypothetical protein NKI20_29990, partial [Mesorhizobium sp. M0830]|uniref:hypothetical protein n=1 Tax=Mesorhizobium sp. M0830 TaxID=2957008 RepID=UPI003336B1DF
MTDIHPTSKNRNVPSRKTTAASIASNDSFSSGIRETLLDPAVAGLRLFFMTRTIGREHGIVEE